MVVVHHRVNNSLKMLGINLHMDLNSDASQPSSPAEPWDERQASWKVEAVGRPSSSVGGGTGSKEVVLASCIHESSAAVPL